MAADRFARQLFARELTRKQVEERRSRRRHRRCSRRRCFVICNIASARKLAERSKVVGFRHVKRVVVGVRLRRLTSSPPRGCARESRSRHRKLFKKPFFLSFRTSQSAIRRAFYLEYRLRPIRYRCSESSSSICVPCSFPAKFVDAVFFFFFSRHARISILISSLREFLNFERRFAINDA